jgi:hypothetical protein
MRPRISVAFRRAKARQPPQNRGGFVADCLVTGSVAGGLWTVAPAGDVVEAGGLGQGYTVRAVNPLFKGKVGDVVQVWHDERRWPRYILNVSARRGAPMDQIPVGGGIVEELFVGTREGQVDVYFRNDQVVKALGVRALVGGNPETVQWGQTPEYFLVGRGSTRYVIKLKRNPAKVLGAAAPVASLFGTVPLDPNALVVSSYAFTYSDSPSGAQSFTVSPTVADCFNFNTLFFSTGNMLTSIVVDPSGRPGLQVDERGHLIATFQLVLTFVGYATGFSAPFVGVFNPKNVPWQDTVVWDLTTSTKLYDSKLTGAADFPGLPAIAAFDATDWGALPASTTVQALCRGGNVADVAFSVTTGYFPQYYVRALWLKAGVIEGLYGFATALQSGGLVFSTSGGGLDGDFTLLRDPLEGCSFTPDELTQPFVALQVTEARVLKPAVAYNVIPATTTDNSVFVVVPPPPNLDVTGATRRRVVLMNVDGASPLFGQFKVTTFGAQDLQAISDATGQFLWSDRWNLKALANDFLYAPDVSSSAPTDTKKRPFFLSAWKGNAVTLDLNAAAFPVKDAALLKVGSLLKIPESVAYAGTPYNVGQTTFIAVNDPVVLRPLNRFVSVG